MTQDVDILSPRAGQLAEELREYLSNRFQIAVRIRRVANGLVHRFDQMRKPNNRHLVDVRLVAVVPDYQAIDEVLVISPVRLIGQKVVSMANRSGTAKRMTDLADIHRLLLTFPELKSCDGPVADWLRNTESPDTVLEAWREIAVGEITAENDDNGY
jgi:hypothetical protein